MIQMDFQCIGHEILFSFLVFLLLLSLECGSIRNAYVAQMENTFEPW